MSKAKASYVQDDVDPDIRQFVDNINQGYASYPDIETASYPRRREIAEEVRRPWRSGGPEMAETLQYEIGGTRLRLYRPVAGETLPAMLYIHGGGWALFSIDTHDRLMREYASRSGMAVLGIDYSLAPEEKFPAALDEIVEAISWMRGNAGELGIDVARLAVGGDSAGANLAVAACLRLREAKIPQLQAMLLNYGAFTPEPMPSYDQFGGPSYCLTVSEMDAFWRNYVGGTEELDDPAVAPLKAEVHDLPSAFVAIAECDILADENRALADKLKRAGVPVEMVVYEGATHSFLEAMSVAPLARRALDEQAHWLRGLLNLA